MGLDENNSIYKEQMFAVFNVKARFERSSYQLYRKERRHKREIHGRSKGYRVQINADYPEGWSSNRKWVYAGRFESVGRVRDKYEK